MIVLAKSSVASIQRKVNDPHADFATPDYCYGFMDDAQKELFQRMSANPIIRRPVMVIVLPSIGVGTTNLERFFAPDQPFQFIRSITSLKERQTTSISEADWRRMTPTNDIKGMTPGPWNRIFDFTGSTILLPGADQDLSLRFYGGVQPQPITKDDSPLIPNTELFVEYFAAFLITTSRGNSRLADTWFALAQSTYDNIENEIIMAAQERANRQKSFSGRVRSVL